MMLGSRELVPLFIVLVGHRLRFLSLSGSIGAFFIGIFVLDGGWMVGGQLIGFFLVGSLATKLKQGEKEDAMPYPETEEEEERRRMRKKKKKDEKEEEEKCHNDKKKHVRTGRDIYQVFATGLIPALICLTRTFFPTLDDNNNNNTVHPSIDPSHLRQPWYLAYLAYVACCCGDTLASEIGMLSTQQPMMLLQKKMVQRGVDGGMTLLGTFASLIGGGFIGIFGWNWYDIYLGCIFGCLGGLFDSILGTLVQSKEYMEPASSSSSSPVVIDPDTGFIDATISHGQLSLTPKRWKQLNNIVNLVSSFLTAILAIVLQTFHIEYGINLLPEFELIIMLLFVTLTPRLRPVPTGVAILIIFLLIHPTHTIEFIITFILYVIWRIR